MQTRALVPGRHGIDPVVAAKNTGRKLAVSIAVNQL